MDSTLKARVKAKIRQVIHRKASRESVSTDSSIRSHFVEHLPSSIPGRVFHTASSHEFVDFLESDLDPPSPSHSNRTIAFADEPINIQ